MQHGSILLSHSEHAPELPGLRDLTGVALTVEQVSDAVAREFARETGWRLEPGDWSAEERAAITALAAEKYAAAGWNEKR
jgi:lipoate-protein ligase A